MVGVSKDRLRPALKAARERSRRSISSCGKHRLPGWVAKAPLIRRVPAVGAEDDPTLHRQQEAGQRVLTEDTRAL